MLVRKCGQIVWFLGRSPAVPRCSRRISGAMQALSIGVQLTEPALQVFLAVDGLEFRGESLEPPGVVVGGDEEHVALECHEIAVETLHDGGDVLGYADDGAAAVLEHHLPSVAGVRLSRGGCDDRGVAVGGLRQDVLHDGPTSHVAPPEVALHHVHLLVLEQHQVQGGALGGGVAGADDVVFLLGTGDDDVGMVEAGHHSLADGAHDAGFPEEDAGVPKEFAGFHEGFGVFLPGFLGERLHGVQAVADGIAALDVAVGGVRPAGLDAQGEERGVCVHELEGAEDVGAELLLVRDELVRRYGEDVGVGALSGDVPRGTHGGRPGGKPHGLVQKLPAAQLRQLAGRRIGIFLAGADVDVLGRHDGRQAFHGELQQRFADAEEVDELLWVVNPAYRPKALADAAGQDDAIVVVFHDKSGEFYGKYTMICAPGGHHGR